ncbi:hypothetical protein BX600DRAFT_144815 [Xylariales sp. PMI_506]|nr:hypothetical protein BX600DRAFT_144815 [Xylariales sp. PMI_506]
MARRLSLFSVLPLICLLAAADGPKTRKEGERNPHQATHNTKGPPVLDRGLNCSPVPVVVPPPFDLLVSTPSND